MPEDDAVESDRRCERQEKGALEELMRERIRTTIESLVDEEREGRAGRGTIAASRSGSNWVSAW